MQVLPIYSEELVEQLNKLFPHQCPTKDMTEREIFYYAGQRNVVDFLLSRLDSDDPQELPKVLSKD